MKHIGRLHKIIIAVSLCLILQLLISWKLWIPVNREYPLLSAFSSLTIHYGAYFDIVLYTSLIGFLVTLVFYPFKRWLSVSILIILFLFILEDITRFQVWLYMFALILFTVILFIKKGEEQVLFIIRLLLSSIYIWSGIQKINHAFTAYLLPWVMNPLGLKEFLIHYHRLGYAVPLIEILIGTGLLFKKLQKLAGIKLIIMHIILLYVLGPFGNSWNKLIWPWNVTLIVILLLLIREDYKGLSPMFTLLKRSGWFLMIMVLAFIMPAFNFIGLWDYYLSGNLYSGNSSEMIFYNNKGDNSLSTYLIQYPSVYYAEKDDDCYVINTWALDELNAPAYPEDRYFKRVGAYLCTKVKDKQKAGIVIIRRKKITSEQYMENCGCDSLLKKPGKTIDSLTKSWSYS